MNFTEYYITKARTTRSPKVLDELFDIANDDIMNVIAYLITQNEHTSGVTLAKLSNHSSYTIRYYVARHKSTFADTLHKLKRDDNTFVSEAASHKLPSSE